MSGIDFINIDPSSLEVEQFYTASAEVVNNLKFNEYTMNYDFLGNKDQPRLSTVKFEFLDSDGSYKTYW